MFLGKHLFLEFSKSAKKVAETFTESSVNKITIDGHLKFLCKFFGMFSLSVF